MEEPPWQFLALIVPTIVLLMRLLAAWKNSEPPTILRYEGVPRGRPVQPAKIETIPDEFAAWESRLTGYGPGKNRRSFMLGIDVRGRFPISEPTQLVLAASVFDVGPHASKEDPPLATVYATDEEFMEKGSTAYHAEYDFGVVDPGKGYRHWAAALTILPAEFIAPEEGERLYRVLIVAFDAANPPNFDHGFVEGDVLWAFSHDFRKLYQGPGYRTQERERQAQLIATMELAILGADPRGEFPQTRAFLERWIDEHADDAPVRVDFDRRGELLAALDGALDRAANGKSKPERHVRVLLEREEDDAHGAIELAIDLLAERDAVREGSAGVFEIGRRLLVSHEDVQVMLDKRVARIARHNATRKERHARLGIDPRWNIPRLRSHLSVLWLEWSARTGSLEDPVKRAEAESMLDLITETRLELEASPRTDS